MKSAKTIINKPVVFIVISIVIGIVVTLIIIFLLIVPKFAAYMSYKSQNSELNATIEKLDKSIKMVSSLDEGEIERLSLVMGNFLPKTNDTLRFLALNETLASSAGVGISSVSLEAGKGSQDGENKGQSQGSKNSFIVNVAAKGFFSNILLFVSNYQLTDRLVGLSEVTIAGEEGILTATLTVELPLGVSSVKASSEDNLVLTKEEKDILKSIEDNTIFSVSPSKDPLGRPDPFN